MGARSSSELTCKKEFALKSFSLYEPGLCKIDCEEYGCYSFTKRGFPNFVFDWPCNASGNDFDSCSESTRVQSCYELNKLLKDSTSLTLEIQAG